MNGGVTQFPISVVSEVDTLRRFPSLGVSHFQGPKRRLKRLPNIFCCLEGKKISKNALPIFFLLEANKKKR